MGADPPLATNPLAEFKAYIDADPEPRLKKLVDGIDADGKDDGSDASFWGADPIDPSGKQHFDDDWIGGKYWPDDKASKLYDALRKAVRAGARLALDGNKELSITITESDKATEVTAKAVPHDGGAVVQITTPPPRGA
ncbi:MAG: hypothetical protein OES57_12770 [Acidimicrobiia bacterium]|nr:hypothetical protein [Acidimicrobiia bacterium]